MFREETIEVIQAILLDVGKSIFLLNPVACIVKEALQCEDRESRERNVKEVLHVYCLFGPKFLPEEAESCGLYMETDLECLKIADYKYSSDSACSSDDSRCFVD
jgi:hypothetical protein